MFSLHLTERPALRTLSPVEWPAVAAQALGFYSSPVGKFLKHETPQNVQYLSLVPEFHSKCVLSLLAHATIGWQVRFHLLVAGTRVAVE